MRGYKETRYTTLKFGVPKLTLKNYKSTPFCTIAGAHVPKTGYKFGPVEEVFLRIPHAVCYSDIALTKLIVARKCLENVSRTIDLLNHQVKDHETQN